MIDLRSLIDQDRTRVKNTLVISIDGHGGSGKSTLARELARILSAEIIATDDFASMENPENWHQDVLQAIFIPIRSGAISLNYERSRWWPNNQPEPVRNQEISEVMILEGVRASRKEFRQYLGLSLFVDTPSDLCWERGVARDQTAKVGSDTDIMSHWNQWIQDELEYFRTHDPKSSSDLIIDGTIPFDEQILGLKY